MLISFLKAEWRLKLLLTFALNLIFWGGYGYLATHAFFPLHAVPLTTLDRTVPFSPELWGLVYLSQFIFVVVLPWLLTERRAIVCYAVGLLVMSLSCFTVFVFFPTAGPCPAEFGHSLAMRVIRANDGPLNAFPSLHAAFLVYMGLLAWRMFGRVAPVMTVTVAVLWGTAILYSTLATKQHYVLDLVAGGIVGAMADWLAWRRASGISAAVTMPRKRESAFQGGMR